MHFESCPICGSADVRTSLSFNAPVFCNVLHETREAALSATKAEFAALYCTNCGHLFNGRFDPSLLKYDQKYDTSLHFSPHFQEYAESLAQRLIRTYQLHNKSIIEIGCGRGDFLRMLCEGQNNLGYGFDTSYDGRQIESSEFLTFFPEYYGSGHSEIRADFVACRHVLEHLDNPIEFLLSLIKLPSWGPNTVVYFEVPNGMYSVKDLGVWDFIYEHFSYFNKTSLRVAFERAGFEILSLREGFGGQYLCLEARCDRSRSDVSFSSPTAELEQLHLLQQRYEEKLSKWRSVVESFGTSDYAIWGAGSKGISFTNALNHKPGKFLVDVNPNKRNWFAPGSGLIVKAPEDLKNGDVSTVIVMNPNYEKEIRRTLSQAGIEAAVTLA